MRNSRKVVYFEVKDEGFPPFVSVYIPSITQICSEIKFCLDHSANANLKGNSSEKNYLII